MGKLSHRPLSIVIAVAVVGGLGLYASTASTAPRVDTGAALSRSATPAATAPATQPVPGMSAGDLPGLIVKVGIVAGLLGGSLWLLRRYAGPGLRQSGRTGVVNIADTVPLAQGRALYVIDIGERALVVGATQQQFSLLAELTDTAVLERLRARPERPAAPWTELSARLSAALGERVRGSDRTRGQAFADVWSASLPEQGQPAGAARDTEATDANARLREMAARIRAARRSA